MHPYFVVCIIAFLAAQSYAASEKTAGEVLKRYSRLSLEERRRALEAGAKQEGVVAFYGTIGAGEAKILIESFHKRHPYVSVRYTRSGTSPLLSRILAEYRGGKRDVDVINLTGATAFVVMERGLVDPYFSSESSMIQSGLMHPKGLWVAVEQDLHVVGYNTRFVSPASLPRSYHDLLDKRWANSVSLDQTDEDWLQGLANEWGEAKAVEFVRSLMQLQPKLQRGPSLRAQLLAAGEFSIALNRQVTRHR